MKKKFYMSKNAWLMQLRQCTTIDPLDRVIEKKRYNSTPYELEFFLAAADHRLAGITMGKNYDKTPKEFWKWIK